MVFGFEAVKDLLILRHHSTSTEWRTTGVNWCKEIALNINSVAEEIANVFFFFFKNLVQLLLSLG